MYYWRVIHGETPLLNWSILPLYDVRADVAIFMHILTRFVYDY